MSATDLKFLVRDAIDSQKLHPLDWADVNKACDLAEKRFRSSDSNLAEQFRFKHGLLLINRAGKMAFLQNAKL